MGAQNSIQYSRRLEMSRRRARGSSVTTRSLTRQALQNNTTVDEDLIGPGTNPSCIDLTCDDDNISFVDLTSSPEPPVVLAHNLPDTNDDARTRGRQRSRSRSPINGTREQDVSVVEPFVIPENVIDVGANETVMIDDSLDISCEITESSEVVVLTPVKKTKPVAESPGEGQSLENIACSVCLDTLKQIKSDKRSLASTVCGHIFCTTCITESQRIHKCCPTCRRKLGQKDFHLLFI